MLIKVLFENNANSIYDMTIGWCKDCNQDLLIYLNVNYNEWVYFK